MEMEEPLLPETKDLPEDYFDVEHQQRVYPDPFYCPLTKKVMEDPVVGFDKVSYERSAVLERDAADVATLRQQEQSAPPPPTYYPNRALQIIIEKEIKRTIEQGTVLMGALQRAESTLRAGLEQVLDKKSTINQKTKTHHDRNNRPLPDPYYCPITLDIISRPVTDPDGNTYERHAILGWIRRKGKSPLTRKNLRAKQLRENTALRDLIECEMNKEEYSNDPSVMQWKESRKEEDMEEDGDSLSSSLREEMEDSTSSSFEEDGGEIDPLTLQEEIDMISRNSCFFAVSAGLLILAWCAFIFIPLAAVPYLLMGAVIAFLNILLLERF